MEYIREMLLRQRTALARLALGGGGKETGETAPVPAPAQLREADLAGGRTSGEAGTAGGQNPARRTDGQREMAIPAAGASPAAGETLRQALARKSAARRAAAPFGLAGTGESALPGRYQMGSGGETVLSGGNGGINLAGEAAGTVALAPERRRPGEAEAGESARALSRTFQRDARRYDGGFRLYD